MTGRRVLVLTPRYPPLVGGAATYTEMLGRSLAGRSDIDRVGIIAPYGRGAPLVERRGRLSIYRILLPRSGTALVRAVARVLSDMLMVVAIVALAAFGRYRTAHVHGSLSRFGAVVANRPLEWTLRALGLRGILDLRDPIVVPRAAPAWQVTICASRSIEARALAAGVAAATCHYVPPPLELDRIRAIAAAQASVSATGICYVGEISAQKGVGSLVEAHELLRRDHPELGLTLVGPLVAVSAEERAWPKWLAERPGVRWVGPKPWAETIAILAGATLVVVPSRADREGIPRVCLEAVALGRKVLFPAGVREFEESDPERILRDTSPAGLARAMADELARDGLPRYDLAPHDPARVFARYLELYR